MLAVGMRPRSRQRPGRRTAGDDRAGGGSRARPGWRRSREREFYGAAGMDLGGVEDRQSAVALTDQHADLRAAEVTLSALCAAGDLVEVERPEHSHAECRPPRRLRVASLIWR
jgi:hypothetical protein